MRIIAPAYYNENDEYAAQWLRNLIAKNLIPPGDVDDRSIVEVQPSDLVGYTQCHFFAGIGGWALAARLAGWPDDRELWTGSCPCQPFAALGNQEGQEDERHLWPEYKRLIRACWPAVIVGEQVARAIGFAWLDGVLADLEDIGYTARALVLPACAVDAPHRRDRIWFVGDGYGLVGDSRVPRLEGHTGHVEDARGGAFANRSTSAAGICESAWSDAAWTTGHDGKRRRVKRGVRVLDHGLSDRRMVGLHAFGNAIVPQEGAQVIAALMDCMP